MPISPKLCFAATRPFRHEVKLRQQGIPKRSLERVERATVPVGRATVPVGNAAVHKGRLAVFPNPSRNYFVDAIPHFLRNEKLLVGISSNPLVAMNVLPEPETPVSQNGHAKLLRLRGKSGQGGAISRIARLQATRCKADERTSGQADKRTSGQADKRTSKVGAADFRKSQTPIPSLPSFTWARTFPRSSTSPARPVPKHSFGNGAFPSATWERARNRRSLSVLSRAPARPSARSETR